MRCRELCAHLARNKVAGKDELLGDGEDQGAQAGDVALQRHGGHVHQLAPDLDAHLALLILLLDDHAAACMAVSGTCNSPQMPSMQGSSLSQFL